MRAPADIAQLALSGAANPFRRYPAGAEGVAQVVGAVGFVQIDTISVVARAHDHVLATRVGGYSPGDITLAEREPRRILEYWAHAASYVPLADYRHCLPRMMRVRAQGHDWYRVDRALAEAVYERVRAEGPLQSKDFEHTGSRAAGWWDWKPAKRALEYLFQAGRLVVARREGFQKVFDIAERQLPAGIDARLPTADEQCRWYVDRALGAYGLACAEEMRYLRREHAEALPAAIAAMREEGSIQSVGKIGGREYFAIGAPPGAAPSGAGPSSPADEAAAPTGCAVLSPFDPFIIQRARNRRLYGWDFSIECYLPAEKRSFGYFALPLLRGCDLAGLIDARMDRKTGTLEVLRLRVEEAHARSESFPAEFSAAMRRFARQNGATRLSILPPEIGERDRGPGFAALRKELLRAVKREEEIGE